MWHFKNLIYVQQRFLELCSVSMWILDIFHCLQVFSAEKTKELDCYLLIMKVRWKCPYEEDFICSRIWCFLWDVFSVSLPNIMQLHGKIWNVVLLVVLRLDHVYLQRSKRNRLLAVLLSFLSSVKAEKCLQHPNNMVKNKGIWEKVSKNFVAETIRSKCKLEKDVVDL